MHRSLLDPADACVRMGDRLSSCCENMERARCTPSIQWSNLFVSTCLPRFGAAYAGYTWHSFVTPTRLGTSYGLSSVQLSCHPFVPAGFQCIQYWLPFRPQVLRPAPRARAGRPPPPPPLPPELPLSLSSSIESNPHAAESHPSSHHGPQKPCTGRSLLCGLTSRPRVHLCNEFQGFLSEVQCPQGPQCM